MRTSWKFMLAVALPLAFSACGGGGGGGSSPAPTPTPPAGGATLSGSVIDGKVAGATLAIYSDMAMANQIGTGTTDATGNFNITLTVTTAPDPVYIKSTGGTNIDTGLPAPTMTFVGNTAGANKLTTFNITPMTTNVFDRVVNGSTLSTAQTNALTATGLPSLTGTNGLYADPTAAGNTTLQTKTIDQLASGTLTTTLPAGTYTMYMIRLRDKDLMHNTATAMYITNTADFTGTIAQNKGIYVKRTVSVDANGQITAAGAPTLKGHVQGANVIIEEKTGTVTTRLAGVLGLNGSISGNLRIYDTGTGTENRGVFVGAFLRSGASTAGMQSLFASMVGGAVHFLGASLFTSPGIYTVPRITSGQIGSMSYDPATGAITASTISAKNDRGTAINISGSPLYPPATATLYFCDGTMLTDAGTPTGIMLMHYVYSDATAPAITVTAANKATYCGSIKTTANKTNELYAIGVVGLRRALGVAVPRFDPGSPLPTVNTAGGIADIAMNYLAFTKADGQIPGLKANTTYKLNTARIGKDMIGARRNATLIGKALPLTTATYIMPASVTNGTLFANSEMIALQGPILAIKRDTTDTFSNNQNAYLRVMEMFPTGALQGANVRGGTTLAGVKNLTNPGQFVGFMQKSGSAAPSMTGTRNFLSWPLYATSVSNAANAGYTYGTVKVIKAPTAVATGTATMTVTMGTNSFTATLTIAKLRNPEDGVYHMHGPIGSGYIDIMWAIGGTRAIWMQSDNTNGAGNIVLVGEAFLTL